MSLTHCPLPYNVFVLSRHCLLSADDVIIRSADLLETYVDFVDSTVGLLDPLDWNGGNLEG